MICKLVAIVILRTSSDLFMKGAVNGVDISSKFGILSGVLTVLLRPMLWIGLIFGAANVVVWTSALQTFDLSYAYPFLSFSFVTIIIGGRVFFNERLDRFKILGIILITIGSMLLLFQ